MFAVLTSLPGSGGNIAVAVMAGLLLLGTGVMLRRMAGRGQTVRSPHAPSSATARSAAQVAPEARPNRPQPPNELEAKPAAAGATNASPWPPPNLQPGPRLLPESAVAAFARTLERSRRLAAAEERVARELRELSPSHWLVERHVLLGAQRVPFVLAGPTGVFLLRATDGAWGIHDLLELSALTPLVLCRLPDYDGSVQVGVCMAFDAVAPRSWHSGTEDQGHGGWVVGLDWLLRWLHSLDGAGLETGDVDALHQAAGPVWTRRATARLPRVRNFG